MAIPTFKSFWPTAQIWHVTEWVPRWKAIVHNKDGAVIGLQSQNANGPDAIWTPTPLTAAQIAAPTAAMLADLNATYQLNESPYGRYYSDGTQLVPLGAESGTIIPPGQIVVFASPLVIYAGNPLIIEGGVKVLAFV